MGFLPRVSASNHNEVRMRCVMFHYGSSQSSDSVSEGMSSSPSSVEQAEMVLSDSEMRSVVSWSTSVWEVSAMRVLLVAVEMVERGSGERGRTVSEGESSRDKPSKLATPVRVSGSRQSQVSQISRPE